MEKKKLIYLDYSATTPVDKEVLAAIEPYFTEKFGNPSSLHSFGQEAVRALDNAREKAARALGADFREIIFTGSATESNNIALRGLTRMIRGLTQKNAAKSPRPRLIISAIEHESVLETARDLESQGVEVVYLPVDKNGMVNLKKLEESLNERTILVSIMYGNNVTGVIQPIAKIANIVRNFRISNFSAKGGSASGGQIPNSKFPLFHTDAVQAFQYLDCDVNALGVDLMTLSSHKIYGPKGAGLLFARARANKRNFQFPISNFQLRPIITGGGQEFNTRSGTENVPAIVGFAEALEKTEATRKQESKRIEKLKNYFWKKLKQILPKIERNPDEKTPTLPHILNIRIPNAPKNLVALLDAKGVAVSSGAACSTRSAKPSYVLTAMGLSEKEAGESIRISLGRQTTKEEIDEAVRRMKSVLR